MTAEQVRKLRCAAPRRMTPHSAAEGLPGTGALTRRPGAEPTATAPRGAAALRGVAAPARKPRDTKRPGRRALPPSSTTGRELRAAAPPRPKPIPVDENSWTRPRPPKRPNPKRALIRAERRSRRARYGKTITLDVEPSDTIGQRQAEDPGQGGHPARPARPSSRASSSKMVEPQRLQHPEGAPSTACPAGGADEEKKPEELWRTTTTTAA